MDRLGSIRPIRVQQITFYLLCVCGVPDSIFKGTLSCSGIYGGRTESTLAVLKRSPSLWKNASVWEEWFLVRYKRIEKGFAVNNKREIRFGLGGLKGVGEAAVESIIEEREKNGSLYLHLYDLIKRVNQRTVNKKTLENLVYAGAFDWFKELHRAQYFKIPTGETITEVWKKSSGSVMLYQTNANGSMNTPCLAILQCCRCSTPQKFRNWSRPWTLTELLDHEKDVTGMFMSGHPLDHFRFEI